jgi:exodeoxyribonuclease VII small subunit
VNQALSYEQARDELTEVVKRLEAGGLTLEQSLDLWERGEKLAAICAEWLEGARARIATAMAQRAGQGTASAEQGGASASRGSASADRGGARADGDGAPQDRSGEPNAPF